jgi:nitroreductase/NAD-dependent dihydropyrimidine dehydrogenase PreA subunit
MDIEGLEETSPMGFLSVDVSKCNKDSICVSDCPMALVRCHQSTGYPCMIPGGEEVCVRCGHCIAACPQGALRHSRIPVKDCAEVKPELTISEEQAVQFLRSRRSVRAYKDQPVERKIITRLIEIARYAPTGGNGQSVEWLVLTDRTKLHDVSRLAIETFRRDIDERPQLLAGNPYLSTILKAWEAGRDPILWNAPALVVASAPNKIPTGMADVCIALSYLDLFAPTIGLGTCWAGLLQQAIVSSPSLKEFLGIPDEHSHHFPMMLGHPKSKYYRLPGRKPPKLRFEGMPTSRPGQHKRENMDLKFSDIQRDLRGYRNKSNAQKKEECRGRIYP